MNTKPLPSVEYLNERMSYDMVSGVLTWKVRPVGHFKNERVSKIWNTKYSGKVAGTRAKGGKGGGHINIFMDGEMWTGHRLAWKIVTGRDPFHGMEIDHANGDYYHNAWTNLREVTKSQNQQNKGRMSNNKHGLKGVFYSNAKYAHLNPWTVRIRFDNKNYHVGAYPTKGLAAVAYAKASLKYHGKYSMFARP